uniref:Uncharacterized protein n=1 Tax=Anguilla anguilla TaxID=7936 RepID=A0A0E9XWD6_ANGAN
MYYTTAPDRLNTLRTIYQTLSGSILYKFYFVYLKNSKNIRTSTALGKSSKCDIIYRHMA